MEKEFITTNHITACAILIFLGEMEKTKTTKILATNGLEQVIFYLKEHAQIASAGWRNS